MTADRMGTEWDYSRAVKQDESSTHLERVRIFLPWYGLSFLVGKITGLFKKSKPENEKKTENWGRRVASPPGVVRGENHR